MSKGRQTRSSALRAQLIANQLWETVSFIAKAGFLVLLTPLMLKTWGSTGYGEFAVASSVIVIVTIFDFGIRGRLRLELCRVEAAGELNQARHLSTQAACTLACACLAGVGVAMGLVGMHFWSRNLRISHDHESLIVATAAMASLTMFSGQLLEPLVAKGRLGEIKLATAIGSAVAIPMVWWAVSQGSSSTVVIIVWMGLLSLSNAVLFIYRSGWRNYVFPTIAMFSPKCLATSYHSALSINLISISGLAKTHGLTLVVSAIDGPATAGVYFIFLRLAEIISSLGAVSNDLLLAELPRATSPAARRESFRAVQRFSLTLTFLAAACVALLTPGFLKIWLKMDPPLGNWGGLLTAFYGLSTAFRHTACNAGAALSSGRLAAAGGIGEAIVALALASALQVYFGIGGTLVGATLSAVALIPAAKLVAHSCGSNPWRLWLWPWAPSTLEREPA